MQLDLLSVNGGSGVGGAVNPGDAVWVTFELRDDAGAPLALSDFASGSIYISGPTNDYQRVVVPQFDLLSGAYYAGSATWVYAFVAPFPSVYAAPVNDSASFGVDDGERTGQPIVAGTYSVGIEMFRSVDVGEAAFRDAGSSVFDFAVGGATTLEAREVVNEEACEKCHVEVRAHGGTRVGVRLCLLCHTAGSEDRNNATEGGTPGVSVDFKAMIHQLHNAKHLPSVLGVGTNADGSRTYAVAPKPLKYVGFQDRVFDLSAIGYPVMPSAYVAYLFDTAGTGYTGYGGNGPMPKDLGYTGLTAGQKYLEDQMRAGVVACGSCHGGAAQSALVETNPSRAACGSCHDDVDWSKPYLANGQSMGAGKTNPTCALSGCHTASGTPLSVRDAHLHPYSNPALNTGINLTVTAVGGGTGTSGRHQVGDNVTATFNVKNDMLADVSLHATVRGQAIVTGPTENPQMLAGNATLFDTLSFRKSPAFTGAGTVTGVSVGATALRRVYALVFTGANAFDVVTYDRTTNSFAMPSTGNVVPAGSNLALTVLGVSFQVNDTGTDFAAGDRFYLEVFPTAASYTMPIPTDISFERVGVVPGTLPASANVSSLPLHWGRQTVFEVTAVQTGTGLGAASTAYGRHVVADAAAVPGIAVGDRVVLDAGTGVEEYVQVGRIQTTDDLTGLDLGAADRFWFTSPLRFAHLAGAQIQEVTLTTMREGTAYTVTDPAAGQLTILAGTAGNPIVVTYRTDLRFGFRRFPGDALQAVYPAPVADTDAIDAFWGDWVGLPLLDGTYTVGFWLNRDYTVTTVGPPANESTSYRMIAPPATRSFLFGSATTLTARTTISDMAACDRCHADITFHGNGRRGLETCFSCHAVSGMEDGPRYTFNSYAPSYIPPTQGVTMDFRTLLHKIHMGKELAKGDEYVAIGVFLGVPYPARYGEYGFPVTTGGVNDCASCHGTSTSWQQPAARVHPSAPVSVRAWRASCGACHDSDAATAHMDTNSTVLGVEACGTCHGPGKSEDVVKFHVPR